ncbi:MAG: GTP-binding protein, partial [Candidatus Xenobia bacterium]
MAISDQPIRSDVEERLALYQSRDLLRFLTAGSVDDGKSTLIGRMLYDSGTLYQDQLQAVERESQRKGHAGGEVDLSLLTDG